ncbi:hypothetical protein [Thauera sp.]|jgi:hypothetical protein|uniref:hypothetical protein n=1 Tax=Thauera sp. TaxID=1905334 RepID=UPI002A36CD99|nr:hypothetical protein [Thauera sp.]MDX9886207.1 hypothetical protein [Thauera sp.]
MSEIRGQARSQEATTPARSLRAGLLRLALIVLAAAVLGLVFAAYQHPALLLDFGSLMLMCG